MSFEAFNDDSAVMRHESHVITAVHYSGLFPVLRVALAAWWTRPRVPPDMPARLRADMGLPPDSRPIYWPEPSSNPQVPPPMWRAGL